MQNCDVLLAVGARFDDRVIGNPKHFMSVERKIIHIDIDPFFHLQACEGGCAYRGRRERRADRVDRHDQGDQPPSLMKGPWRSGGMQIEAWRSRDCLQFDRHNKERDQAPVRGRYAVQHDQGRRRVHHLRRGPAPDVGRAVLPL